MTLNHVDLFSGIGGFALAARWAGIKTVVFCEQDKFCQKVLNKNFPGVPIENDIKEFHWRENQCLEYAHIKGVKNEPIFLLTAGVPCQPASCAGKRRGTSDDRWLWGETFRVIAEVKPKWVILENVRGLLSLEQGVVFDNLLSELENLGYETTTFIIPACAVNAPHRRDRVWIVANAGGGGLCRQNVCLQQQGRTKTFSTGQNSHAAHTESEQTHTAEPGRLHAKPCGKDSDATNTKSRQRLQRHKNVTIGGGGETRQERGGSAVNVSDSPLIGLQGSVEAVRKEGQKSHDELLHGCRGEWSEPWLEVAARLCGIFNGLSDWMDRNTGGLNAKITQTITGQDMPHLWDGFQSETLQWSFGRFNTIHEKENLFTVLWQLFRESYGQDNLSFESATVQKAFLSNVWSNGKSGRTSQRWEYNEQYEREHRDALSLLSHEIASLTKKITYGYGMNRVDRLKSLGNAIVPQVAFEIMKAILKCEATA